MSFSVTSPRLHRIVGRAGRGPLNKSPRPNPCSTNYTPSMDQPTHAPTHLLAACSTNSGPEHPTCGRLVLLGAAVTAPANPDTPHRSNDNSSARLRLSKVECTTRPMAAKITMGAREDKALVCGRGHIRLVTVTIKLWSRNTLT